MASGGCRRARAGRSPLTDARWRRTPAHMAPAGSRLRGMREQAPRVGELEDGSLIAGPLGDLAAGKQQLEVSHFFSNDPQPTEVYTLSRPDALPLQGPDPHLGGQLRP